ncbi:phytanoyl-CoA dioxygenase family protein [Nitzschia inconspicua]|uniref:Phytanoyl-CoA dioxygenase family protein n=1 Tax=Nitzschia inconspicua TaxID=303405 RepID=A0A9K3Q753_9STRA|nr:phytanoyl-CoA dioxygenase family protein [Nitzschia inconspicua]
MTEEDDGWVAFGSDDEDEEDVTNESANGCDGSKMDDFVATKVSTYLTQVFVKHNPQIRLEQRKVLLLESGAYINLSKATVSAVRQRAMHVETIYPSSDCASDEGIYCVDALVCLDPTLNRDVLHKILDRILCPGGTVILPRMLLQQGSSPHALELSNHLSTTLQANGEETIGSYLSESHDTVELIAQQTKTIRAHASTCPWLPSSHSTTKEEDQLHQTTVRLSSHEILTSHLTESSVAKAVYNMQHYGYCILPRLLDHSECKEWGRAVLDSVHAAATILLERDSVDIYHPQSSQFEPQSYQELSMREDLRMDIRQGPALSRIRVDKGDGEHGNESIVLTASSQDYKNGIFLRGHAGLLEIVRRTMNPKDQHFYKGNIGRWNFGGSGSDGSFQDLRLSPVGGIVSLPGAADQALHADTPHLFETISDLPAHYINIFAPCTDFHEQVGGTAFVHGSHNLAFTATHCGDSNNLNNSKVYPYLVRPKLTVGDVVLFDCRILHFGLANTSKDVERCICYTNTWHNWFHDAKNWDKNRAIFESEQNM